MTYVVVVTCDGRRHGQPCRGAYPTGEAMLDDAERAATAAGWRATVDDAGDLCPSRGHDEEPA